MKWVRIPVPIEDKQDRRSLIAIIGSAGLPVREVSAKKNPRCNVRTYFVEYGEDE